MRALRDNAVAIQEGDDTAPAIVPKALGFAYFLAKRTTNQTIESAEKIAINSEDYDPDSLFDAVTNFRFTPNQPGLYRVGVYVDGVAAGTANTQMAAMVAKNGSIIATSLSNATSSATKLAANCETIVQMNGSTDYLEAWANFPGDVTASCVLNNARFYAHALCEI